ncbi:MAG: DUF1934 domain-containing protein [Fusobacteria bacterium]|nr:DUF1934 domain-containing protein [Fusobacteriota bacterium]
MNIYIESKADDIAYNKKFICEKINENSNVIYKYEDNEKNNIKITIRKNNTVVIQKKGEISYTQILKEKKRIGFLLKTPFFSCEMAVSTNKILVENKSLYLEYDLYNNNELVNKILFILREE